MIYAELDDANVCTTLLLWDDPNSQPPGTVVGPLDNAEPMPGRGWTYDPATGTWTEANSEGIPVVLSAPVTVQGDPTLPSLPITAGSPLTVQTGADSPLVTADLPSQSIAFTGNDSSTINTTTPVQAGMSALLIMGAATASGVASLVNVIGVTTGTRYAWQAVVGNYKPLVVPIDPAADALYSIRSAPGNTTVAVNTIRAYSQPPKLPPGSWQSAVTHSQGYSGNTSVSVISGTTGALGVLLKRIAWRMALMSTVTGYQIMHIQASTFLSSGVSAVQDIDVANGIPGTVTTGEMDFTTGGGDGLLIQSLAYVGNSTSTSLSDFALTATYEPL